MWCFKCAQFEKLLDIEQMLTINGWCPLFTGLHRYRHFLQFCTNCTNLPLFRGSPIAPMPRCPSFDRGARPLNNRMEPKIKTAEDKNIKMGKCAELQFNLLIDYLPFKNGTSKQHVLCYRINLQYSPNLTKSTFTHPDKSKIWPKQGKTCWHDWNWEIYILKDARFLPNVNCWPASCQHHQFQRQSRIAASCKHISNISKHLKTSQNISNTSQNISNYLEIYRHIWKHLKISENISSYTSQIIWKHIKHISKHITLWILARKSTNYLFWLFHNPCSAFVFAYCTLDLTTKILSWCDNNKF